MGNTLLSGHQVKGARCSPLAGASCRGPGSLLTDDAERTLSTASPASPRRSR
ncbi:MAG: hypothetical protein R3A10_21620 [Caldilineaceae bacterium]